MSRNVHAPNTIRGLHLEPYRAGRAPYDKITCNKTEGYFMYISGAYCGLRADIHTPNMIDVDSINLSILESYGGFVPWSYYHHCLFEDGTSKISFELDDADTSYLQQMVIFYDFLYGK